MPSGVSHSNPRQTTNYSFITSTNNHIPRITSLLHRLCDAFSPVILVLDALDGSGQTTYRLFPKAEAWPTEGLEQKLREMGFGYRAGFLDSTLDMLRSKGKVELELEQWRSAPINETRDQLLKLKGVGRKVADCVMLMSMDQVRDRAPPGRDIDVCAAFRHPCGHTRLFHCRSPPRLSWSSSQQAHVESHL